MRALKNIIFAVSLGLFSLPSAAEEFEYYFNSMMEIEKKMGMEEPIAEDNVEPIEEEKEERKLIAKEESKDFYIKFGGGIGFMANVTGDTTDSGTQYNGTFETKNPGILSIGLGKEFNEYRIQFEYTSSTIKSEKLTAESGGLGVTASMTPNLEADTSSYMIYGLKKFNNDSKLTPYAGIGLGISSLSLNDQTVTLAGTAVSLKGADESVFSYALRGGTEYEMSENIFIYSEATYQNFAPFKSEEPGFTAVNFDSNHLFALTAGLKFNF